MKTNYRGIIPPMVTPLSDPDTLDVAGLRRLIEHLISGGVAGIFILGTTGEGPNLSYRLRRELIDHTCKLAAGRTPILVGITDSALYESIDLAKHAADAGAQAVVAAAPPYFPNTQPELVRTFTLLAERSPLPLFLYNMPQMTKTVIEPATVKALTQITSIIGIKDSSGDMEYFKQILTIARQRPDWTVLIGPEHLLAESVAMGGHGGVNGGANLDPRLYVDLYEAARRHDEAAICRLQRRVAALRQLYHLDDGPAAVAKGIKGALALCGLCSAVMTDPFTPLGKDRKNDIDRIMAEASS